MPRPTPPHLPSPRPRAVLSGGLLALLALLLGADIPAASAPPRAPARTRRILYNLDGDSCLTRIAQRTGPGPVTAQDLVRLVDELTVPGSQVDTLLVCVNAQVMYYPTRVGTQRGTRSTPEERARWSPGEVQRFRNVESFAQQGLDPYEILFRAARRKGLETMLTFRMNDDHGNDFLRTRFREEHPEYHLGRGALDFSHAAVRDHVFQLIEEAVRRYDCEGLELDFQRFPRFFPSTTSPTPAERVALMSDLVRRVRALLEEVTRERGRAQILSVRVPSDFGTGAPTPGQSIAHGCDIAAWARAGWIDFVAVSEWLFTAPTLHLSAWRAILPDIPVYAGIQPESQPTPAGPRCEFCLGASGYRRVARERWADGADGIYLFNFFTPREWESPFEPPFEVLTQIGSRDQLAALPFGPWETNTPIAQVRRELVRIHPRPRAAAMSAVQRVGPGPELREWRATESRDDVADDQAARWSLDNGRTWTDWVPQQPSSMVRYGSTEVWEGGWADRHDPASGLLVQLWLRQIQTNGLFHCFSYVRTSPDLGRTWSTPSPLRYEDGPDFDPALPGAPSFLDRNEGYPGNNIALLPDGRLVTALAHANALHDPRNASRAWRLGSVLFLGRWDADRREYQWTPGARTEISPEQSARGLMEPEVIPLKNHRILVVWRGSNTAWDGTPAREPGRKWHAVSEDGGRTISTVSDWRYSDGTPFYSPSSIHRAFRHSVTGRLYWIGNLTPTPPNGNHPRHPLVLAEIDEVSAALRKDSVTILAERQEYHGPLVQFSNFSLYEDPDSREIVLHLTTYGQEPAADQGATADAYRFRIRLFP